MEPQPNEQRVTAPSSRFKYQIIGYLVSFALGIGAAVTARYLLAGKAVQLNPDTFVSLIFTVAVGAGSTLLALLAINYGRVSEKVITERADKSIEIQMSLFQKSLDLQTQLFDRTMSTLEAIGRSTGVTEQRIGDLHSILQNPALVKQAVGKAVEEAKEGISKEDKSPGSASKEDARFADHLTKSIVQEISTKLDDLEKAVHRTSTPRPSRLDLERSSAELVQARERRRLMYEAAARVRGSVIRVLREMPDTMTSVDEASQPYWDFVVNLEHRHVAFDVRIRTSPFLERTDDPQNYDPSILQLAESDVNYLVFVFIGGVSGELLAHLENRSKRLSGRVKYIVIVNEAEMDMVLKRFLEQLVPPPNRGIPREPPGSMRQ